MKQISSKDNRIFKLCKKLAVKKYRDQFGLFIAEGPNLLKDLIYDSGFVKLDTVILKEGYLESSRDFTYEDFRDVHFEEKGRFRGATLVEMAPRLFDEISETKTSQGIILIVKRKAVTEETFFESVGDGNVLVLDKLQDPGNIGTLIRTADAAGYKGVVAIKGCTDIFSPKVVRAASGSVFRVPVLFADTPEQAAGQLHKLGKTILSTGFDTDKYYYDIDMKKNVALVIGNEGNGVCKELTELADLKIKIPMCGVIDSLNASVAAGILMYESMRPEHKQIKEK